MTLNYVLDIIVKDLEHIFDKHVKKPIFIKLIFYYFIFYLLYFLVPYLQHMEVPWLGIQSELQLPAYATATAVQDPSCICYLHHSSQQCWLLNPLRKARDQIPVLMDTSWICYCWATMGNPVNIFDSLTFLGTVVIILLELSQFIISINFHNNLRGLLLLHLFYIHEN